MRERLRPGYWLERLSLKRDRNKTSRSAEEIGRLAAEFDTIFENAALGIVITDEVGRFVRTNRAYERFLGYEKDELIGRSARRVTHPDHYSYDVQMFGEMTRRERDGYLRTEDREAALRAGVNELVLKPNTVEELGEVLHRLLSQPPASQLPIAKLARVEGISGSPI